MVTTVTLADSIILGQPKHLALPPLKMIRAELARRALVRRMDQSSLLFREGSPYMSLMEEHLRYIILEGGRGSAKSWAVAERLVRRASREKRRVLCTREYQNSITESVHKLLSDTIERLGLENRFRITDKYIESDLGSEFIFKGLHGNIKEVKSTEGVDDCWVEEAQTVSKESWTILIPTILRKHGSQFFITFNAENESDDTYQRFVVHPPKNSITHHVNFDANPHFPAELEELRQEYLRMIAEADDDKAREQAQADYDWVWLGMCKRISNEIVLSGKIVVQEFDDDLWKKAQRPLFGADFGFSQDPNTLIRFFILDECLYIEHEAYGTNVELMGETIDKKGELERFYESVPGSRAWPIKADGSRPETISFIRGLGFACTAADKWPGSVEDGIAHLRSFRKIIVHPRCKNVAREAKLWRYKVDRITGQVLPILVPGNEHCIAQGELIETARGAIPIENVIAGDFVLTRAGMKRVQKAWMTSPSQNVWEIKAGGKTLLATPNHEVFTTNRGFIRVDALKSSDELLISVDAESALTKLVPARVQCVRDTKTSVPVYDLTIEDQHEFFASGILVHNCFDAIRYGLDGYIQRKGDLGIWSKLGKPS